MHEHISMTKYETAEGFHCGRCGKDKKSKSRGEWQREDGTTVRLCNGCYGLLNSQGVPKRN
ncbi:hypothetical protein SEA_SLIMJIMMY_141 [Mycobacterium phage SlimJimmy]|uniref:Uncharacterized protein n=3 Tax=Bongovirus bongo TaxID=1983750 RepID=A0A0M3UKE8_9CAUD|nr:hypothetical protein SEA_BRICOLE_145 [Mycobacterium phage Bricole]AXQ52763.1 hypothetical protein SEA_IPHANE7_141 [Mycobacterium phage IPhane7]QGJ93265.1 hypothetical protein SEA_TYDAWG_137 [Mycobacterium phage TyDawg]WMI33302.1 hypothetical protein SEA_SLIMJIMMY_141 [Mycobacterium phage SlimJimmy]